MLFVLWAVLNLALFLIFLWVAVRAFKLIRREMGFGAAIFLVICLISIAGRRPQRSEIIRSTKQVPSPVYTAPAQRLYEDIYENPLFTLSLYANYTVSGNSIVVQNANVNVNGFLAGIYWQPEQIDLVRVPAGIQYSVVGTFKWALFNVPIYTQYKNFVGLINKR